MVTLGGIRVDQSSEKEIGRSFFLYAVICVLNLLLVRVVLSFLVFIHDICPKKKTAKCALLLNSFFFTESLRSFLPVVSFDL